MKSSCIEGCLDIAEMPAINGRLSKLHQWAEEDKEFLRNMVVTSNHKSLHKLPPTAETSISHPQLLFSPSPQVICPVTSPGRDYACRQRYLRSYTFETEKQSPAQRTKKYIAKNYKNNKGSKSCDSLVRLVFAVFFMCMVKADVHN